MAKLIIEIGGESFPLECSDESMAACVLAVSAEANASKVIESVPAALIWIQSSLEAAAVGFARQLQAEAALAGVGRAVEIKRLEGRASVTISGVPAFPEAAAQLAALLAEAAE